MQEMPKFFDKNCEKKWQERWQKENLYKFDMSSEGTKKPVYSIDMPPPTVSGLMHLGHAYSYSHIDFIARFWRMKGFNVFMPFGFDDNGLATERFVEQKLKIRAVDMQRKAFVELCRKETEDVEQDLRNCWASLGLSVDWSLYYRTINDWCQRTSQRSFIEIYNMGRVYQKEAPSLWCPVCRTAIAQVELEDAERSSTFVDIKFRLADAYASDENIIISTTRPEMLPACVAIFVHPDDKRHKKLIGRHAIVPLFSQEVPILSDERVDPEKGSGIVMCCTFGDQTDMEWWSAYNLPLKSAVGLDGRMTKICGEYEGMGVKEARAEIIRRLEEADYVIGKRDITHAVNTHERCGTDIEIMVTKQWFIRYLDLKDEFLRLGKEINWHPEHMRSRYEHWVKGLQWDWCISRQRFFGVPFPLWYCKNCGSVILAEEEQLPVDPLFDKPTVRCKCGSGESVPDKDVMDTWATSSLTPQIAGKWIEDEPLFKKVFPMSLRPQAHDIITFWAFNTIVKAHLHNNSVPWKNIMISGHALDAHGKKMSKSKGNVIDPMKTMEKYSADCLRFWAACSKLGDDLPFQEKDFITGQKFITKFWNASKFALSHLKDFDPRASADFEKTTMDKWILSRLNKTIQSVTESFEEYEYSKAKSEIELFFWHDVCDFYLEIAKDRLYNPGNYDESEVESAKSTLNSIFVSLLKMIAPIMPHMAEEIYQYFAPSEQSIHTSGWPDVDEEMIDTKSEEAWEIIKDLISGVRRYKTEKSLAMNALLGELVINCKEHEEKVIKKAEKDIIAVTKVGSIKFAPASQLTTEKFGMNINLE